MYFEYEDTEEYDEDDFFYHMYFDEVTTTALPDEFYDILDAVSGDSDSQVMRERRGGEREKERDKERERERERERDILTEKYFV